jgi:hypothetical protein
MRPLPVAAAALLSLAPFLIAAGKPIVAAKGKPPPTASASASSATVSAAPTPPPPPVSSAPPAVGSTAVSPLTPRPDEAPPVKAVASTKPSAAYDELMADVAALRARVGVIANAVWKSRLSVSLRTTGSHARIAAGKMLLDGAPVWTMQKGFNAEDYQGIFDGGVAAGLHAVTLEIEVRDDRDETFRTIDRTTATVVVPQGKKVQIEARLDDDSDMGDDYSSDGEGEYDVRLRMKAKVVSP